jgi:AAHS family 4-hydroxybenzoate transporter-like MFS transporter
MSEAGHSTSQAVLAGTFFWLGGMVGNLLLGWCVDRRGFGPTLTLTFIGAALTIAVIGQVAASMSMAGLVIAAAGFCVLGGQTALNALAAVYYPTSVRSTGMGWAMGIGRFGSIFGPVIGGELMRFNWSTSNLFIAAAVPAVIALFAVLAFWRLGSLPATARSVASLKPSAS